MKMDEDEKVDTGERGAMDTTKACSRSVAQKRERKTGYTVIEIAARVLDFCVTSVVENHTVRSYSLIHLTRYEVRAALSTLLLVKGLSL